MIHTVSLQLSKQLKEAGFPQDSYFSHTNAFEHGVSGWFLKDEVQLIDENDYPFLDTNYKPSIADWNKRYFRIAAPTAEEILDLLPKKIKYKNFGFLHIDYQHERIYVHYADEIHFTGTKDESFTDLLARVWLYLKKEGLLTT